MFQTNDDDDFDPRLLTPADFEAADEALRRIPIDPPDPAAARVRLAVRHRKLGADRFRFVHFLREPLNCCETLQRDCWLGLRTRQEFDEHVRQHIENDLSTAKLAQFARELNCQLDAYSSIWEILCFTPLEEGNNAAETDLSAKMKALFRKQSKKTSLFGVELMYISEFLAEVRIEKGAEAVELLGYTGTCAADLGWLFPRLLDEAWQKSSRAAEQQYGLPSTTMAIRFFRRTYRDQFPTPRDLSVLVHRELALARIVLRARTKASTADAAPTAISTPQVVVTAGEAIIQTAQQASSTNEKGTKKRAPLLTVADWGDLGIAFDHQRHAWAISPPPSLGEEFSKRKAHKLPIRGRLVALLELFASSADGSSSTRHDALRALKMPPAGSRVEAVRGVGRRHLAAELREQLRSSGNFAFDGLNKVLSDLGHKLRRHVDGPKLAQGKAFYVDGDHVRCGFVVRPLITDDSRHSWFGVKPE